MSDQYQELYNSFEWLVPNNFNIAEACCHRWASINQETRQTAIFFEDQVGQLTMYPYRQLAEKVNKLAHALSRMGITQQDRVLVILEHSAESIIANLAILSLGAISVPLSTHLSAAMYEVRAHDSQAKIAIVDKHSIQAFMASVDNHSTIRQIIGVNTTEERIIHMDTLLARQSSEFPTRVVAADTPAFIFYPEHEGTRIRGSVIAHKALIGNLPGFVASQDWFPKDKDVFWTSYNWNSAFGLLMAVLPVMYFGCSLVGCPSGRTIPRLYTLLEHYQVTNVLASAEELQRIKDFQEPLEEFDLALRCFSMPAIYKTAELKDWIQAEFNSSLNGIFALPEFGYLAGDSAERWPDKIGTAGRIYPGHCCAILDPNTKLTPANGIGNLHCLFRNKQGVPDPAIATQYWQEAQLHDIDLHSNFVDTGLIADFDKQGYLLCSKEEYLHARLSN
ncbi:AMP-binding protein [Brackiella oedipodis]|uniref:AMP-binding protein n=1 Tax=Brackiella oedipodis TaxID=124225 RepID=UPI0006874813|nr:AMP-binding protein [Brackiella oedipodis]